MLRFARGWVDRPEDAEEMLHCGGVIAGVPCDRELAGLSDYLDGALALDERIAIEEHVRLCDVCERFGGEFAALIDRLRLRLSTADPLPHETERRLRARLGL